MSVDTRPRKFIIWAEVKMSETTLELPWNASDKECESECRAVLDDLIGNGDTGFNEILQDVEEV